MHCMCTHIYDPYLSSDPRPFFGTKNHNLVTQSMPSGSGDVLEPGCLRATTPLSSHGLETRRLVCKKTNILPFKISIYWFHCKKEFVLYFLSIQPNAVFGGGSSVLKKPCSRSNIDTKNLSFSAYGSSFHHYAYILHFHFKLFWNGRSFQLPRYLFCLPHPSVFASCPPVNQRGDRSTVR